MFPGKGQSVGLTDWKSAPFLTLYSQQGLVERRKSILGLVASTGPEDTESIFVGLIDKDDNRPTFVQQIGKRYSNLCIHFNENILELSKSSRIPSDDPDSLKLIDLTPFGPNLHHYAVSCSELVLYFNYSSPSSILCKDKSKLSNKLVIPQIKLDRKLIVVLDTGLTGCIFSDSLTNELISKFPCFDWKGEDGLSPSVGAMSVQLPCVDGKDIILSSRKEYFYLDSFRLPWFDDEDNHPHIIAVGTTFWANTKNLSIDLKSHRAKISFPR